MESNGRRSAKPEHKTNESGIRKTVSLLKSRERVMKISFMNWTSKSILVASALCVSAVAQAQDATYSAEAAAYAVAVQNDLANASASIVYESEAEAGETRISDVIYIIGDEELTSGQDFVVRANSDYTLEITVPTLPYGSTDCQPAFFQDGVSTFGAVGELLIATGDTLVTFNDLGFATQGSDVSASISCNNGLGQATISFDVNQSAGTSVDTFTFGLGFLPDGARDDSGANYGAQQEPPAGTYSLNLTASLEVG